jgi:hypothetical protein
MFQNFVKERAYVAVLYNFRCKKFGCFTFYHKNFSNFLHILKQIEDVNVLILIGVQMECLVLFNRKMNPALKEN